jgi:hypothetical protein
MHGIVHVLVYACTTAFAVLVAVCAVHAEVRTELAAWTLSEAGGVVLASVAGLLAIAPLAHFLAWWGRMLRSREISYATDHGRIAVSLVAIEEALTRALEGEPEVKKAHVRVHQDRVKGSVVIDAVMTLWEVPNVTERNRFCQRLLRRRFAELMPEQDLVQVHLALHRLNVRRPAPTLTAGTAPAPIAAPAPLPPSPEDDGDLRPGIEPSDDLYVGPAYPVPAGGDDDDAWQARPATVRTPRPR